jgi:hypothetical protein
LEVFAMKHASATALCLLMLALATPALATPLGLFTCAESDGSCVPMFDSPDNLLGFEAVARPRIDTLNPVSLALVLDDGGLFDKVFYRAVDGQYYAWHARDFARLVFGLDIAANGVNLSNLLRQLPVTSDGGDVIADPILSHESRLDPSVITAPVPASNSAVVSNPEPATLLLLGSGLVAVATALRRSQRSVSPPRD